MRIQAQYRRHFVRSHIEDLGVVLPEQEPQDLLVVRDALAAAYGVEEESQDMFVNQHYRHELAAVRTWAARIGRREPCATGAQRGRKTRAAMSAGVLALKRQCQTTLRA